MPLGEIITRVVDGQEEYIYMCSECEAEHLYEDEAHDCCTFMCENCGEYYESVSDADNCCSYSCPNCHSYYSSAEWADNCCEDAREQQRLMNPEYPEIIESATPEYTIYIPEIEGRPARVSSIEQELSAGGSAVARMLHRIGISDHDRIVNYSYEGMPGLANVKEDASLPRGGGEVVYSRFLLNEGRDMGRLAKAMACIRALEAEGIVDTTGAAGTHIHLSALDTHRKAFGPAQIASLYEIFSFGEDVIFRLGAAGWPDHRGTQYTRLMPKLNKEDRQGITASKVVKQAGEDRHFSLNFRRLLDAVHRCRCGSCVVGDWDSCECNALEQGTIEWRVFNATTDPEILHSWLLLAHGITGAAFGHTLGTLEPHDYNQTDPELHPWIFGWLLWNCPFDDSERQLLFNTARKSPGLNLPWENVDTFHEGWEQMEVPEVEEERHPMPDPFEVAEDPYFDTFEGEDEELEEVRNEEPLYNWENGCRCEQCRADRERVLRGEMDQATPPQTWNIELSSDMVNDAFRRVSSSLDPSSNTWTAWTNTMNAINITDSNDEEV